MLDRFYAVFRQPETYFGIAIVALLLTMAFDPPHKNFIFNCCANLLLLVAGACLFLFPSHVRARMASRQIAKLKTTQVQETPLFWFRIMGALGVLITASHLRDLMRQWPF